MTLATTLFPSKVTFWGTGHYDLNIWILGGHNSTHNVRLLRYTRWKSGKASEARVGGWIYSRCNGKPPKSFKSGKWSDLCFKKIILAAMLGYDRKQPCACMSHKAPLLGMKILIIITTHWTWGFSCHRLSSLCRKKNIIFQLMRWTYPYNHI